MKQLFFLFCMVSLVMLISGCGHGMLIESETTGFSISIPVGESTPLNITVGMTKTTTATVRGGTTVETTSVAGGGIFSGDAGIGKKTTMRTNAQLNEGNLRKVMTSPDCPPEAKIILASNLVNAAAAPTTDPMVVQTTTATVNTGPESIMSNTVHKLDRVSGVDKIVETVPQVTTPIVENVAGVVSNAVNATTTVTTSLFDKLADMCRSIKWSFLFKALCAIASVVGLWLWLNKDKKVKPLPVLSEVDPNLGNSPSMPHHKPTNSGSSDFIDVPKVEPYKPNKNKPQPPKKGIWATIFSTIGVIINLILRIPPETRKKIVETVKNWFKKKKSSK